MVSWAGGAIAAYSTSVTGTAIANFGKNANDLFQKIECEGGTNGDGKPPQNQYSLKKIKNNKEANEIAQKLGFEGAEDLKEAFAFRDGTKFNMMYNSSTGEIILVSIKDSSIKIATGLFK